MSRSDYRPQLTGAGDQSALNLSASTVVVVGPARAARVSVSTAGSTAGGIYDAASVAGAVAAALIGSVPAAVGVYLFDWPCLNGLVYVPGTGQIASVSFT
jgi:hypothetical protein